MMVIIICCFPFKSDATSKDIKIERDDATPSAFNENETENEEEEDDDDDDDEDMDDTDNSNLSRPSFKSKDAFRPTTNATPSKIFFKRSDSTLMLGCEPTDPFTTPLKEALPLADRPQLLNPMARRDQLFGVKKQSVESSSPLESQPLTMKLDSG